MKKKIVGQIELQGDKLYYIVQNGLQDYHKIDVTPVWAFFKEVQKFIKQPK